MGIMNTKFFAEWDRLRSEKVILCLISAVLSLVIVVLTVALISATKSQRVVVLPPSVSKEFWTTGRELSSTYFEQVAFYLSDRLLTVSPTTAQSSFDSIINFADPTAVARMRRELTEQVEVIKAQKIYQVFYPGAFTYNLQNATFTVKGDLKRFSENVFSHSGEASITFSFVVKEGRLFIRSFEVHQ